MARAAFDEEDDGVDDRDAPSAADAARFGGAPGDDEDDSDYDDEAFDELPERWDGARASLLKKALIGVGVALAAGALLFLSF